MDEFIENFNEFRDVLLKDVPNPTMTATDYHNFLVEKFKELNLESVF